MGFANLKIFFCRALIVCLSFFPVSSAFADSKFQEKFVAAALERTHHIVVYYGGYVKIKYPGGDVSSYTGVCTDVVIWSYRTVGIDLQQKVHEDMKTHFKLYPENWGLKRPDTNIDHRRVPNLQVFFKRRGIELPVTRKGNDYKPGDLVTWNVGKSRNTPHIWIVTNKKSDDGKRPLVVHNIGWGPELEDMLFDYEITGHYRYPGVKASSRLILVP